jgi:LacI family transcriptional regulator
MPTISDVAKAAKVSVGTVSHYLNGSARVAEETALRIQRVIDELDYQVDLGARGLRAKHTRSVGLLLPNISNPFYAEIARSIERHLSVSGYQVLLCDSFEDSSREDEYLSNLVSRRVDGILMVYSRERDRLKELAKSSKVPVVFVDRGVPGTSSVQTDNRLGGRLAARHLIELGHRRIGVMAGEPEVRNVQQRVEGFREELEASGLRFDESLVLEGEQALSFGQRVEELLLRDNRPTAIFTTNDIVAVGAWRRILELGYHIPRDIALLGFDDIEMSRLTVPALTTVAQDKQALGQRAVALLLQLIEGAEVARDKELLVIPPTLVERGSTKLLRDPSNEENIGNEVKPMTG